VARAGLQMCCNVCGLLLIAFPNAPLKAQGAVAKKLKPCDAFLNALIFFVLYIINCQVIGKVSRIIFFSLAANVSVVGNVGELKTEHLSHVKLLLKY